MLLVDRFTKMVGRKLTIKINVIDNTQSRHITSR